MIDDKTFDDVSQFAHAGCAAFLVLVGANLGYPWTAAGLMLLWALGKEFIYDEKYETPEVRGSSLTDFAFYCVGIAVALLFNFLRGW